jgi:GTP-binding protein Era
MTARAGFVSLIGRPNAGKSTLLNQMVGTKLAIVSDKPQTTRNRILGVRNLAGGQIVFVDTPGIHRPLHRMNVRMVDLATSTIGEVDVLVVVLDAAVKGGAGDEFVLELVARATQPVVLALNKIDLIAKNRLLPIIDRYSRARDFAAIVPVSALTGDGSDALVGELLQLLPVGEPLYPEDYLTDQPERVLVAETVREKLLQHTHAELPFSTAVVVDRFEEPGPDTSPILRLYCSILVDRNSQKAIVIGRAGALLKQIGTEARVELERFFGTRVYLDLHVRVREGWRENERILDDLGVARRRP